MQWQSPLIVLFLFVLRLVLPLLALMGIGYLYERHLTPRFSQPSQEERQVVRVPTPSLGQIAPQPGYAAEAVPCWEFKQCTPEQMAQCLVPKRPGVPCWLTRQVMESKLPEECVGCDIFQDRSDIQADYAS